MCMHEGRREVVEGWIRWIFIEFILGQGGWGGLCGQVEGGEGPQNQQQQSSSIHSPSVCEYVLCVCVCACMCVRETVGFSDHSPGSVGVHSVFGGESEQIQSELHRVFQRKKAPNFLSLAAAC